MRDNGFRPLLKMEALRPGSPDDSVSVFFESFSKPTPKSYGGIPCEELDSDFAAQRIKKLSLYEAIKNALFPSKEQKHKTLVDQFAYPLGGTGAIYQRMADSVESKGGKVHLNTPVKRVIQENGEATALELEDGSVHKYDHIISTMPLTLMVSRLPEAPPEILERTKKLKFRNTIIVFLNVDAVDLFPDQWLYVHSPELDTGRITNFRNWIPEIYGNEKTTVMAMELWCYDEDPIWKESNEHLIEKATNEIRDTGLIGKAEVRDGHVYRIPRCYPVYDTGYKDNLKPVENYLESVPRLHVIGRYGAFKYNNQDHSILMGMLAAENIVKGTSHDLWEINTDYETYQESYIITETGLSKQG
jgi:protoporphyrinogen oxidase